MYFVLEHIATGYLILEWLLRGIALLVVPRRRPPASGTAWLLFIFLLPVPGWIVFLALGYYKLPQQRQDIQKRINKDIDRQIKTIKQTNAHADAIIDPILPSKYQSLEDLTQEYGRLPSMAANSLDILTNYDLTITRIVDDISQAKHSVYLEYYTLALDASTQQLIAALEAARHRGIDVRVLYDSWGSHKYPGRAQMLKRFAAAGVSYRAMLPLRFPGKDYVRPDLRNHRKIVIIDSAIGYTGSQNMIDSHYNRKDDISYDELVVRVTGPVVFELSTVFMTDWISEGGSGAQPAAGRENVVSHFTLPGAIMQVLPSGPGFIDENNLKVFTHLFHLADKSITIVNPYFVPPESMLSAITSAAKRGVKVRMINSKAIDQWMIGYAQRSFYSTLLEAGVELYLYKSPKLLHAKFIVVDDEVTVVGSSNMDMRSFELNSELSLMCYDDKISIAMTQTADHYIQSSSQLQLEKWQDRPVYKRLIENVARLTSSIQ